MLHKDADQASDLLAATQLMAAEGLVETRRAVQALRTDTLPSMRNSPSSQTPTRSGITSPSATTPAAHPGPAPGRHARAATHRPGGPGQRGQARRGTARGGPLDYGDADVRLTVRNDLPPGADTRHPADVSTVNGGYGLPACTNGSDC